MAVEARRDIANLAFILSGEAKTDLDATIFQDAGRTEGDLLCFTLMSKIAATGLYVPYSDETAFDGTAIPMGIYIGTDIPEADIIAGNVTEVPILIGGPVTIDEDKLVIENSKLLTTVVEPSDATNTIFVQTVGDYLHDKGIYPELTIAGSGFETT